MVDIKFLDAELHLDELNNISRFDTKKIIYRLES